jgi:hypothetical protein
MESETLARAKLAIEALHPLPPAKSYEGFAIGSPREKTEPFFEVNAKGDICHIYWGGKNHEIVLDQIKTHEDALGYILYMCEKSWPLMTTERIAMFITFLSDNKGWKNR